MNISSAFEHPLKTKFSERFRQTFNIKFVSDDKCLKKKSFTTFSAYKFQW